MAQINGSARSRKKPVSVLCGVVMTAPLLFSANPAQADAWGSGTLQYEIVVRDAMGEVLGPELYGLKVLENTSSTHMRTNSDEEHFDVSRRRSRADMEAVSVLSPTDPSFDMTASSSFTGGMSGTFTATANTSVGRSYVAAYSGVRFELLIPVGGSLAINGTASATVGSVGFEYNGVQQLATANVALIVGPMGYNLSNDIYAASTALAPGLVENSLTLNLQKTYENTFAFPRHVSVSAISSISLSNSVTAVPEPSIYLMMLCGLATLAVPKLRRRRVDRVEPLLR